MKTGSMSRAQWLLHFSVGTGWTDCCEGVPRLGDDGKGGKLNREKPSRNWCPGSVTAPNKINDLRVWPISLRDNDGRGRFSATHRSGREG
jgi:hypothetical protein